MFKLRHALQLRQISHLNPKLSIWQDITYYLSKWQKRYKKRYEDLQNQHQDFIKAIQASPNGVILLDKNGYIKWLNSRMNQLLNISKQDKGQRLQHLLRQPEFVNYWHNPSENGIDIQTLTHVLHIKLLTIDENNLLFLAHDVTQRHKINQLHKDFIANVSHELSTPLSSIVGFSETLSNHEIKLSEDKRNEYIEYIHKSASHMQDLVKDLLLIAELDHSKAHHKKQLNIYDICKTTFKEFELSNATHKFIWQEHIDNHNTDLIYINGIEKEIKCVLNNLLDNAVKYTPINGNITFNIRILDNPDKNIKISIIDNGLGISKEHIELLTNRFYRVPNNDNSIKGNGLGLYIVEQILKKHNSKLDVESELNQGSCFSVLLQLS
jgi:two-component system phosphate regulon sensor histidine kinase PhoR